MINLDDLRAVVRPYVGRKIDLQAMLVDLWPLLRSGNGELAESIQDELALHASRRIDEIALRQRLAAIAFAPGIIADANISEVYPPSTGAPQGGLMAQISTFSTSNILQPV